MNKKLVSLLINRLRAKTTSWRGLLATVLSAGLACFLPSVHAASTWNGAGGNGTFENNGNWVGGVAPVAPYAGILMTTANQTNVTIAASTFNGQNSLIFDSGATSGFTFSGGNLTITGANYYQDGWTNNSGHLVTVNNNIILSTQNAFGAKGAGSILTMAGNINIGSGRLGTYNQTGGVLNFNGVLSGTGSVDIDPIGPGTTGTTYLNGANTYSGATTVAASTAVLIITNNSSLGSTAAGTSVIAGGSLQIQNNITVGAEALTINGTGQGNGGALRNNSGTNTYGGLVTLAGAARINSDAGTLTLSNTGTITGATFGLTVGGAGNTTIASAIGTTTGTLTKDGAGTVILSGANTYTGSTTVSAGTLLINGSSSGTGDTTVASGATFGRTGSTAVSLGGNVTFSAGSHITLSLGAPGSNSSLTRTGGTWAFDSAQAFTFDNLGATTGAYSGLIAGLGGSEAGLSSIGTWTISNAGWTGTFSYSGGSVNLNLTAIPEPATWALLAFSLTTVMVLRRRLT